MIIIYKYSNFRRARIHTGKSVYINESPLIHNSEVPDVWYKWYQV